MSTVIPKFTQCVSLIGGISIPSGTSTKFTAVVLSGDGPSAGPYEILDNSKVVAIGNYGPTGQFAEIVQNLDLGPHKFELRLNVSTPSTSEWTVEVEGMAKTLIRNLLDVTGTPEIINDEGETDDQFATVHGAAEPASTVSLYDNGVPLNITAVTDAKGNWIATPKVAWSIGAHTLTAVSMVGDVQGPVSEAFDFAVAMESEKSCLIWSFLHELPLGSIPIDLGPITLQTKVISGNPGSGLSGVFIWLRTGALTTQNGSQKLIIKLKKGSNGCVMGFYSYALPAEASGVHVGEIDFFDENGILIASHQIHAGTINKMLSKTFVMPDEKRFSEIVITQYAAPSGRRRHWYVGPFFLGDAKSLPSTNV